MTRVRRPRRTVGRRRALSGRRPRTATSPDPTRPSAPSCTASPESTRSAPRPAWHSSAPARSRRRRRPGRSTPPSRPMNPFRANWFGVYVLLAGAAVRRHRQGAPLRRDTRPRLARALRHVERGPRLGIALRHRSGDGLVARGTPHVPERRGTRHDEPGRDLIATRLRDRRGCIGHGAAGRRRAARADLRESQPHRSPGFNPSGVIVAKMSLQSNTPIPASQLEALFERALGRVRAVPGVVAAAATNNVPVEWGLNLPLTPPAGALVRESRAVDFRYVTPDYFTVLRVPVRAGRVFDDRDRADGRPVAIVNEAFARAYSRSSGRRGRNVSGGDRAGRAS